MSDLNQSTAPSPQAQPITGHALLSLFRAALGEGHRPHILLLQIASACSLELKDPQDLIRLAPADAAKVVAFLGRLQSPPAPQSRDGYRMIKEQNR